MKLSQTASELLSGHEIMMDGQSETDDGQGDYYRASADFAWGGPNKQLLMFCYKCEDNINISLKDFSHC